MESVFIKGVVGRGNSIGTGMGYPTANIVPDIEPDAAEGVYAALALIDGRSFAGMANLGFRPTVGGSERRILEINLFDYEGDLYGRQVEVELIKYIRPEKRFPDIESLRKQLSADEKIVRRFFETARQ